MTTQEVSQRIREIVTEAEADRVLAITDSNVNLLTADFLPEAPRFVVKAGEENKNIDTAGQIWQFLIDHQALRRSLIINIGGGMVSDLGGFCAATFKRGLRYINVATTLLAAVDASVGGKTAINFGGLKNEVGAFHLPLSTLPLTSLFDSLPEPEWLSGVGEAIKTGMLAGESLFELATSEEFIIRRNPEIVKKVVDECIAFKTGVVEEDFREAGRRGILNLGHTAGHAIEALMMAKGTPMPHGIAVAHGIHFALAESIRRKVGSVALMRRYEDMLFKYFPPLNLNASDMDEISRLMGEDKKNRTAGLPAWILIQEIGAPVIT